MKRIIYIDFENVSTAGLNGILDLNEKDHVKIFLGPKCSKLSLIEAEAILHCNATVELITNDQIGKNALDFIIMVHMGYDIAKKAGKAFYIISKDKGYEPAIHEMQSMTGYTIERLQDIKEVLTRDAQAGKGSLFGFLNKKEPQVENTTEHEVYEKGKRVGKAKRSTRSEPEQKAEQSGKTENNNRSYSRGNAQSRDRKYEPGRHREENRDRNKRRDGQARAEKVTKAAESVTNDDGKPAKSVRAEQNAQKPVLSKQERRRHERVKETPAAEVNVDEMSVAELAQELGIRRSTRSTVSEGTKPETPEVRSEKTTKVENKEYKDLLPKAEKDIPTLETEEAAQTDGTDIGSSEAAQNLKSKKNAGKKERGGKRPEPINEAEQAMIERAIATCKDKEAYHNFLMGELRDTIRATELYKMSRNRFLRAKDAEKESGAEA